MSKQEIEKLINNYITSGKTKYLLIVRDTKPGNISMQCPGEDNKPRKFDTSANFDFPVVVLKGDPCSIPEWVEKYSGNGLRVVEVYDLEKDIKKQLAEPTCWSV